MISYSDIATLILVPAVRTVAGWGVLALKDNKIEDFEWRQLGVNLINISLVSLMVYFGLDGMGFDVNILGASAAGFIIDKFIGAIKDIKKSK